MSTKVYATPYQPIRVIAPYSEVLMHMGIAGRPVEVYLIEQTNDNRTTYSAQVIKDGHLFSSPITYGEAGFYRDEQGFYTYADDGPGDENPKQVADDIRTKLEVAFAGHGIVITDLGLG